MITSENLPEVLNKVAWPFVAVIVAIVALLLFRSDISLLLRRVKSAKMGDKGAEFSEAMPDPGLVTNRSVVESPVSKLPEEQSLALTVEGPIAPAAKSVTEPQPAQSPADLPDWLQYQLSGEYRKSHDALLAIDESKPITEAAIANKAWAAHILSKVDFAEALREFQALVKEFPSNRSVYSAFVRMYQELYLYDDALNIADEAIRNLGENHKNAILIRKAVIYEEMDRYEDVIEIIGLVLRSRPDSGDAAAALLVEGRVLSKQSKFAEARVAFLRAASANPTDTSTLLVVANFFRDKADYRTELYHRYRLTELEPKSWNHWMLLGNSLYMLEFTGLAMNAYENAAQLTREPVAAIFGNIGNAYNRVGLHSNAIASARRALEIEPGDKYAHEKLTEALVQANKEQESVIELIASVRKSITTPGWANVPVPKIAGPVVPDFDEQS